MAKFKEELTWVALNVDSLPASLQTKHKAIRDAFDALKVLKAAFEDEASRTLTANAAKLPVQVKADLKVTDQGTFPTGSVLKFSYMRGVAVATASAPKAKANGITFA